MKISGFLGENTKHWPCLPVRSALTRSPWSCGSAVAFRCRRRVANLPDPHRERLRLAASNRGHQLPRGLVSVKAGRSDDEEGNQARQKQASLCFVLGTVVAEVICF